VSGICTTSPTSRLSHLGRLEFRRTLEVPTFIGSSDNHREFQHLARCQLCDEVSNTGHVRYWYQTCLLLSNGLIMAPFQNGLKNPLVSTFGGCWFYWLSHMFWALRRLSNPLLVNDFSILQNPTYGLSEIQIWEKATLSTYACLLILWFAFVTIGLFGPRWLGVAGEHPRIMVCLRKFVTVQFHSHKGRNKTCGRRKRSWKRLRLEWPSCVP
jgi:hypothetical protein